MRLWWKLSDSNCWSYDLIGRGLKREAAGGKRACAGEEEASGGNASGCERKGSDLVSWWSAVASSPPRRSTSRKLRQLWSAWRARLTGQQRQSFAEDELSTRQHEARWPTGFGPFEFLIKQASGNATRFDKLAQLLFPAREDAEAVTSSSASLGGSRAPE